MRNSDYIDNEKEKSQMKIYEHLDANNFYIEMKWTTS